MIHTRTLRFTGARPLVVGVTACAVIDMSDLKLVSVRIFGKKSTVENVERQLFEPDNKNDSINITNSRYSPSDASSAIARGKRVPPTRRHPYRSRFRGSVGALLELLVQLRAARCSAHGEPLAPRRCAASYERHGGAPETVPDGGDQAAARPRDLLDL